MTILTKEDLETKSIAELIKVRADNFEAYVKEAAEIRAKYALLDTELESLRTKYHTNGELIIDVFHQKTNIHKKTNIHNL